MPDEPILWMLLILTFIFSAFFSASETAFITANRFKLRVKAEDGNRSAKLAMWVINKLENSIVTIVISNNIVNLLFTSMTTIIMVGILGDDQGLFYATLISVVLIFTFGEAIPKALVRTNPERFAMFSSYLISFLIIVFYPISMLFRAVIYLAKQIFKFHEDNIFSADDFESVIESIEEQGIFNEDTSDIILSTLDFSETVVKDVLTPKQIIVAYDISKLTTQSFNKFILKTNYSRIPLYDKTIDKIVGVIVVREYIKHYINNGKVDLRQIMSKPYFVSYKISLTKIIEGYKKNNTHIAFVRDDKNMLLGMVTMEDVLEELVGQIAEPISQMRTSERDKNV